MLTRGCIHAMVSWVLVKLQLVRAVLEEARDFGVLNPLQCDLLWRAMLKLPSSPEAKQPCPEGEDDELPF